ncbi:carbohydrate ABC transporter permease [Clostridium thermarum]|uniref:carbohydrate ABC transporter permease n=1 Tax=Clostridium thermarum TaxID=1716543 RepID=UPI0011245A48|nr:carbohydrate ABC transporter permease [Clostridium thermarum]
MKSKRRHRPIAVIITFIVLSIFAIFCLAPFIFMLQSSFKPGAEMIRNGITINLDFESWNLNNYKLLYTARDGIYLYWFRNSIIITALFTACSLFFSSLVGYGLAAYDFKGKRLLFIIVLIVMTVPVEILILPLYKLTINLKLIDTYAGVILPFMVSPFAIFFFRQYAVGIPKDFIDAGRIDGCSEYSIYFRIMLPLMKPAFGAMTILQAMTSWNSFVWPLIVLRSDKMLTLQIGLQALIAPYGNNYDLLLSGAVMSIVPIVILFLFNQKAFISGLTVGGVKG